MMRDNIVTINIKGDEPNPLSKDESEGLLILINYLSWIIRKRNFESELVDLGRKLGFPNIDHLKPTFERLELKDIPKFDIDTEEKLSFVVAKISDCLYSKGRFGLREYEDAFKLFERYTDKPEGWFYKRMHKIQPLPKGYTPRERYIQKRQHGADLFASRHIGFGSVSKSETSQLLGKPILPEYKNDFNYALGLEDEIHTIRRGKPNMTSITFREKGIEFKIQYNILNVVRVGVLYQDIVNYICIDDNASKFRSTLTLTSFSKYREEVPVFIKCRHIDLISKILSDLRFEGLIPSYSY